MRYAKRDANHVEIVDVLRRYGFSVYDAAHAGRGFPDLVVGFGGVTWLIEIKDGEKDLEDNQQKFANEWRGSAVVILRSRANAVSWATNTRHELRRKSEAKALTAIRCVHREATP